MSVKENIIDRLEWVVNQNEKSDKNFWFTKSKKEVDHSGEELGIIVYKIGFLVNIDSDFKMLGKKFMSTSIASLI